MSEKLDQYTKAIEARDKFMADNPALFAELNSLEAQVAEAEKLLKVEAREKGDMDNGKFKVTVTTPYSKWFDWTILKAGIKKPVIAELASEGILEIVPESLSVKDFDKFQRHARENGYADVLQQGYKEEAGTPRVSIVKVKAE